MLRITSSNSKICNQECAKSLISEDRTVEGEMGLVAQVRARFLGANLGAASAIQSGTREPALSAFNAVLAS